MKTIKIKIFEKILLSPGINSQPNESKIEKLDQRLELSRKIKNSRKEDL